VAALGHSQVLAGLGRYDEAAKAVDAARKANPQADQLAALLAAKGRAYLLCVVQAEASEEPDGNLIDSCKSDAQRWAREALKADPKNVEALLLSGQLAQKDADEGRALRYFEEAVAADPKSFDAAFEVATHWYVKANSDRKNMELWAKAESGFAKAFALDPKSGRAAANLAHCKAWQVKNMQEVGAAYLKAVELNPEDTKLLGTLYNWTPKDDRAELFMTLCDAAPKEIWRRIHLARALSGIGEKSFPETLRNYEKAYDALDAAARIDDKNPIVPFNEGEIRRQQGKDLDAAVGNYVESIAMYKQKGGIDDDIYKWIAGPVAFEDKSLSVEQREKLWTHLWKAFPERYDAMNNAGLYYRDTAKDYKQSLEWYLRAAKAAPDDASIQNDTGLIYHYHLNDMEKAEPFYRRAVAVGNEQGLDCTKARGDPDRGFHDAINNLYLVLKAKKRWKDLKEFAEKDVPDAHPMKEAWIKEAEKHK
jgi:tetratricopeptide (TPR) repeat protein